MRIAIGADHAGFALKEHLKATLAADGHEVVDLGTDSEASVDYPPICADVGRTVVKGEADRGIVLGGSGQGEQMAANKVRGVRAALCNDLYTARLSREHNDANVLAMGGRIVAPTSPTRSSGCGWPRRSPAAGTSAASTRSATSKRRPDDAREPTPTPHRSPTGARWRSSARSSRRSPAPSAPSCPTSAAP